MGQASWRGSWSDVASCELWPCSAMQLQAGQRSYGGRSIKSVHLYTGTSTVFMTNSCSPSPHQRHQVSSKLINSTKRPIGSLSNGAQHKWDQATKVQAASSTELMETLAQISIGSEIFAMLPGHAGAMPLHSRGLHTIKWSCLSALCRC